MAKKTYKFLNSLEEMIVETDGNVKRFIPKDNENMDYSRLRKSKSKVAKV